MNHAIRLNNLIEVAKQNTTFEQMVYQPYTTQDPAKIKEILDAKNYFLTSSVLGMEAISHVIEDYAIAWDGNFSFYTGCQKLAWLKPHETRYKKLCERGKPVKIYGVEEKPLWSYLNLVKVPLESPKLYDKDNLALNWFVIYYNPKFVSMALVGRELSQTEPNRNFFKRTIYRNFEGFWTYNQAIIEEAVYILEDYASQYLSARSVDAASKSSQEVKNTG